MSESAFTADDQAWFVKRVAISPVPGTGRERKPTRLSDNKIAA